MTPLIENIWDLVKEIAEKYTQNDPNFIFRQNRYGDFKQSFEDNYNKIKKEYMLPSVENLDRHKVASIIIVSLLEIKAISYKDLEKDNIFIGAELIALKVALAYLIAKLNEKLEEKNVNKKITEFIFPKAQSCETSYIEIMCRNLYYAKRDYELNPLDLAERLFLIEYIALTKAGINPDVLKDY